MRTTMVKDENRMKPIIRNKRGSKTVLYTSPTSIFIVMFKLFEIVASKNDTNGNPDNFIFEGTTYYSTQNTELTTEGKFHGR